MLSCAHDDPKRIANASAETRDIDHIRGCTVRIASMAIRSKRYVADYQREGEQLVAVCKACQRTSILSYVELNRRAIHMRTLEELPRFLRCR